MADRNAHHLPVLPLLAAPPSQSPALLLSCELRVLVPAVTQSA